MEDLSNIHGNNPLHPDTLEEKTPSFIIQLTELASNFLSAYGWYFAAICLVIVYYWEAIQSRLDQWYEERSNKEYVAKSKKDPDSMRKKQLEMEAARKRMQEELDLKAAINEEKIKEKEEKRRAELLASTEGGQRLGGNSISGEKRSHNTSSTTKTWRSEYNPLMGSGSSGGYRPPRRGCPGGGCG